MSPDEQARTNLRQNLSTLRKFLAARGVAALVTEGDRVALDPEAIDLDVATFERLCAAGTLKAYAEGTDGRVKTVGEVRPNAGKSG